MSENTSEYKVVADKIVSPDSNIIISIAGDIYKGSISENNRIATVADIGEGGGGGSADTGDITFDGVKIIGAGEASGDGSGYSTMELVPDADLYENDQYLIIDPTAPNHIHIRAGGTQDDSNAELYLGGEKTYVRIADGAGIARMQAAYTSSTSYSTGDWTSATVTEDEFNNRFIEITDPASYILDFLNSSSWNSAAQTHIGFDGGEKGPSYGQNSTETTLTFYLEPTGTPFAPVAITSIEFYYEQRSRVEIDMNDDEEIAIVGNGIDINIGSTHDISIDSGDYIRLDATNGIILSSSTGGEYLNNSDSPNNQIATIGDIPTGATGTFTSADNKTITVTNGIITDITAN